MMHWALFSAPSDSVSISAYLNVLVFAKKKKKDTIFTSCLESWCFIILLLFWVAVGPATLVLAEIYSHLGRISCYLESRLVGSA